MATNRTPGSRAGLIHCNNCGEDYSASYKRCPFCDEYEDDYAPRSQRSAAQRSTAQRSAAGSGGKRLASGSAASSSASRARSGGGSSHRGTSPFQILSILISLAVIIAAFWIVTAKLVPLIQRGGVDTVDADASPKPVPSPSAPVNPSPDPGVSPDVGGQVPVTPPEASPPPVTTPPAVSVTPAPGEATSFTMKSDVTLGYAGEVWKPVITFSPAGASSTLTWESENPSVVSVTAGGVVTAVSKGTTNIKATMPNGAYRTCIVRCVWDDSSSTSTPSPSPTSGGSLSSGSYGINNPDFTFDHVGETYKVRVTGGYEGSVTWSSSNPAVATVSSDGTCTAVGTQGQRTKCVVTGTLENGSTVKADVYVDLR